MHDPHARRGEGAVSERRLAAIMFTDMVGYSALAQRSEELALELLEEHRRLLSPVFSRYGGTVIVNIATASARRRNTVLC
jgi:class 3 adenylate cyclase